MNDRTDDSPTDLSDVQYGDGQLDVDTLQARLDEVREQVGKRLVGQREVLDDLIVCLLCDGNALLESNPGLAKTLTVRTLSNVIDLSFSRVQNTPDLMPSDITGTEIIREGEGGRDFVFEKGPIFANIVLADEINRATPKTQAALLEAMEEKQVTAAGQTYKLPEPFFLLATQNPIDQEGSLHPDESLYMDGRLWRAGDALSHAREHGELVHEDGDTRMYDAGGTTQTLGPDGELRETPCMVYEVDYEGETYSVETKTGRTIRVSADHPFLVNRAGAIQWVKARDLDEEDHLVAPREMDLPAEPFPSHDTAIERLRTEHGHHVVRRDRVAALRERLGSGEPLSPAEVDDLRVAADLTKRELADRAGVSYDRALTYLSGTENGLGETLREVLDAVDVEAGDYVESHARHRIDDELADGEAGLIVGFVLAEGHVTDSRVSVRQKNLPDLLDRWIEIVERVGLDVRIREDGTGREAVVDSKPFVDYLAERYDLREPERLLSAPEAFKRPFLETFLLTESHYDAERRRVTFVQTDRTLTNLVAHLLLGEGIVPWLYEREDRFEVRIQGEDVTRYLDLFEWRGETPDAGTFESAHRTTPLPAETVERVVDCLGMKHDSPLSERDWYNSYRCLRTKRDRMATSHFESFLEDAERTLDERRERDLRTSIVDDLGDTARRCGLSLTDVVEGSGLTNHRGWEAYESEERPRAAASYVVEEYTDRIDEAAELTEYLRGLVDGDVFYDRVTSIETEPYEGPVVGLSVPETHNYLAGFGACGINHNTYALPEAQSDRFLLKILVDYPSLEEEIEVVDRYTSRLDRSIPVETVLSRGELREAQELVREVPIAEDIRTRAVELVRETRNVDHIEYGASPRASMALVVTAKARALLEGRAYVSEEDIEAMARPVLRHRIIVDFRAEREGMTPDDAVEELL
jgi:MoxR-like ATPase/intein/homing endonuclease